MTMQMLWGLCVAIAALTTGSGVQLFIEGAPALASYPLVVGGILLLPAGSALLQRFFLSGAGSSPTAD